jgi:uncharacterized membrane protein
MSADTYAWVHLGHVIGFTLWVAGLVAVAGLLRAHEGADAASRPHLVTAARSMALIMDIGGTLAIAIGLTLAFKSPRFVGTNAFKTGGWLHVKLALVAVGLLAPSVIMRIKIGKLRRDAKTPPLPAWVLPLVLVCATGAIILGAHPTLLHK